MTRITASFPGVSSRKGTAPTGIQDRWLKIKAGSPRAFLARKRSTRRMAGSLTTWDMKGRAARMPTSRLLAPSASA